MRATELAGGLDHPEGVCCDPDAGVLYAGGELGQLYRVSLSRVARGFAFANYPVFGADGTPAMTFRPRLPVPAAGRTRETLLPTTAKETR